MMETLAGGTETRGLPAAIGHTPLVSLDLGAPSGTRIYAKLESVNPGGSVKDRPVLRMLTEAVRAGRFSTRPRAIPGSPMRCSAPR
jgi:S-sulfo-L-cysteine synthase (O-acetyl-L-serine-dependent)